MSKVNHNCEMYNVNHNCEMHNVNHNCEMYTPLAAVVVLLLLMSGRMITEKWRHHVCRTVFYYSAPLFRLENKVKYTWTIIRNKWQHHMERVFSVEKSALVLVDNLICLMSIFCNNILNYIYISGKKKLCITKKIN
jgi:hypothetical protein